MNKFFCNRYRTAYGFLLFFLIASFFVRLILLGLSWAKCSFDLLSVIVLFGKGMIYDLGVAVFFCLFYTFYLLLIPERWNRSAFNRIFTYTGFSLTILVIMFSFFAEIVFWQEFESRFNFIAVDYLVYTYEVINNINESYPLPLLIGSMLVFTFGITWLFYKKKVFHESFYSVTAFSSRLLITSIFFGLAVFYLLFVKNSWAETGTARYTNELSKAGIYSFFAAFKSNELDYKDFYKLTGNENAFRVSRNLLKDNYSVFLPGDFSIRRKISSPEPAITPNVIMITIESMSAVFLNHFTSNTHTTPVLDSLAGNSLFFTAMYATGNRTVRGMEALSLSIPPTPGSSIVKRADNEHLVTVGSVFKKAGYDCDFLYGGDGYFDNMNKFFGNNGFDITDRGKRILPEDDLKARRHLIPDKEVHFENAWGICDEDLYDAVIKQADSKYAANRKFYDFVMTTSNHRPYTYPAGKIDIPPGSGREGAVRYTDYALGQFLSKIKNKPWYPNTVIILIADHCANSAGKNEIDISKYHIPCWILNTSGIRNQHIDKMCSQIDLYPTLFGLLGWDYESNFFGKDIFSDDYKPRIFCGTYQKLAYLKADSLVILGPQKKVQTFIYNRRSNEQIPAELSLPVEEAIAQYQAAFYLFKNGGLKQ